ncbi:hypothetical protein C9J48_09545 [Photobacterium profundum]|uniref:Outer membrane protein beta-barrel domain-containing protein n=1 Tax=Photobacterium profundum 3TCK TaxID=314280 RepID=Q1YXP6_9GAMM|nr:hypothetical protein [Photobacterium profundum]EAS41095.1 hypothetical protein P3TCK_10153 [Photobacterium profundum 3TCK]PSV62219.1 hypothetical protein C9J48_09545 [Photobacterium profundum]
MKSPALLLPIAFLLITNTVQAKTIHISPDIRLGEHDGYGLQLGVKDVMWLDTVFISIGKIEGESTGIYTDSYRKEKVHTYRLGGQYAFDRAKVHKVQLELGLSKYSGRYYNYNNLSKEHYKSDGISYSTSYVYQATDTFGLRAGVEFNFFGPFSTPRVFDTTVNAALGFTISI